MTIVASFFTVNFVVIWVVPAFANDKKSRAFEGSGSMGFLLSIIFLCKKTGSGHLNCHNFA
eukprot:Awhi_evm1s2294